MTKEEKQLLLIDLCARLPYGVKCWASYNKFPTTLVDVNVDPNIGDDLFIITVKLKKTGKNSPSLIEGIKPYLRPMSSMTEEEREELSCYENDIQRADFYYSHHIDCRFMIEKGIALEAPTDMYKTE